MTQVALTFDDGPSEWTDHVLDILAENEAHATFFVIGSRVEERPEVLRRILDDGHELGNHTWSHPWLARDCDDNRVRDELQRANETIRAAGGRPPARFRAPHYDVDDRVRSVAAELGLEHTRGDITPPDWHPDARAAYLATLVLQRARPGLVIGLHDGVPPQESASSVTRRPTVQAVAAFVPRLRDRGLQLVTASQLIDEAGIS